MRFIEILHPQAYGLTGTSGLRTGVEATLRHTDKHHRGISVEQHHRHRPGRPSYAQLTPRYRSGSLRLVRLPPTSLSCDFERSYDKANMRLGNGVHSPEVMHAEVFWDCLRQAVVCAADVTTEKVFFEHGVAMLDIDGWVNTHQCGSWDAVTAFSRKHEPVYLRGGECMLTDGTKFCPLGVHKHHGGHKRKA